MFRSGAAHLFEERSPTDLISVDEVIGQHTAEDPVSRPARSDLGVGVIDLLPPG